MRSASEIHFAIQALDCESERQEDVDVIIFLSIAIDALRWAVGEEVDTEGPNAWMAAYLLDNPPQPIA